MDGCGWTVASVGVGACVGWCAAWGDDVSIPCLLGLGKSVGDGGVVCFAPIWRVMLWICSCIRWRVSRSTSGRRCWSFWGCGVIVGRALGVVAWVGLFGGICCSSFRGRLGGGVVGGFLTSVSSVVGEVVCGAGVRIVGGDSFAGEVCGGVSWDTVAGGTVRGAVFCVGCSVGVVGAAVGGSRIFGVAVISGDVA